MELKVRPYRESDAKALARLFYDTVHKVNAADYSPVQLIAWAPRVPEERLWHGRSLTRKVFVAEKRGIVLGFAELEKNGHIDCFYVRHDRVGEGIGRMLFETLEVEAHRQRSPRLFAEVSLTAEPFFARMGFVVTERGHMRRRGQSLPYAEMEKAL